MSSRTVDSELAIETVGLTKRYGKVAAVEGLNLSVREGSVFGLIGPNAAGKSTTLRMLAGLSRSSTGKAWILGNEVTSRNQELKRRIGYVPEISKVYPWMKVGEAIAFCRTLHGRWNDELCRELRSRFQLPVGQRVGDLSRGMAAKLSLLLAVGHEPEVLLLDEPTSGLDPLAREEVLDGVLRTVCEAPRTVIFSSHTLADVQRLADDVGILHRGQLLAQGPTDELLERTRRLTIVLEGGAAPDSSVSPPEGTVRQRFERRRWQLTVHGFSARTLEDVRHRFPVEHLEVEELGLEELFKDLIRGREATP